MNNRISVREADTKQEAEFFWARLYEYFNRDQFPDPNDEDLEYFLDESRYRSDIEALHSRENDRVRYLLFERDGEAVGITLAVIYGTEDGKCFIMEFCVFPEHRGGGVGAECAEAFFAWAEKNGARYFALHTDSERRHRFWTRLGFVPNGVNEWGMQMMLRVGTTGEKS